MRQRNIKKRKEDTMALIKELKDLKEKLKYYKEMIPVNNIGKWGRSAAIESYTKRISNLENEILKENDKK